jgi:hypothetical protein
MADFEQINSLKHSGNHQYYYKPVIFPDVEQKNYGPPDESAFSSQAYFLFHKSGLLFCAKFPNAAAVLPDFVLVPFLFPYVI